MRRSSTNRVRKPSVKSLSPAAVRSLTIRGRKIAVRRSPAAQDSAAHASIAVGQTVHHLGEAGPGDALAAVAAAAGPVERAASDLELADLLLGEEDLEMERGACLREAVHRERRLH